MTALDHVRRARATLLATVAGAALLWAALLAGGVILLVALADLAVPVPFEARRAAWPLAIAGAVLAAGVVLWQGRHARRLGRVALYLEERVPALHYALVTAVEPAGVPHAGGLASLERAIASAQPQGALRRPVARALGTPAAILAAAALSLVLLPDGTLERVLDPRPGDILRRPVVRAPLGNRLTPLAVEVAPPRYARQASRTVEDPEAVGALVGSSVVLRGRGAGAGAVDSLVARLGVDSADRTVLPVAVADDIWSVAVRMPAKPTVVRLKDRQYARMVILDPVIDEPPTALLSSPQRDTILQFAKGRLSLVAELRDDIGLGRAEFEVLHTSAGGGETYETRQTSAGRVALRGARTATIRATVVLDSMRLKPGDVLHVRAVTWDENDVTGPGKGESETRMIRILDPRERDQVNITPAKAAAIDTTIMSQRMLNMRAETLLVQRKSRSVSDQEFTERALNLSVRQGQLRGRVESIVFELENVQGVGFVGETPSSRILRQAAAKMQDAQTELSITAVDAALPHMREALKLLERARQANRYWLRGVLTTQPIDVEKIRLTGTDKASVGGRDPRRPAADPRDALLDRLDRALPILARDSSAGRDSLRLILVTALTQAKDAAAPLGEAIAAMQAGRDPNAALVRTRRQLERRTDAAGELSGWLGTP